MGCSHESLEKLCIPRVSTERPAYAYNAEALGHFIITGNAGGKSEVGWVKRGIGILRAVM